MSDHRFVTVENGEISIEVAVQGEHEGGAPLMLFIHGWPELWYSWRHQMAHFADRFITAAINVRGYGNSSNPPEVESYTMRAITDDVAAVIDQLGGGSAIVIGHDWGAPIAWNTARLHPDKVSAVCGLSVPYTPTGPVSPLDLWRERYTAEDKFFYQVYFDDNRGGAEAELAADPRRSLRMIYYGASGDGNAERGLLADKAADAKMLDGMLDPDPFPAWCTPEDFGVYAEAFETSGWHGPLNRYRAQTLDAADIGQLPDPNLTQPAAFIGGSLDPVRNFVPGVDLFDLAPMACDDFRGSTVIDGAGHWIQQEAPEATNAALDEFVSGL